MADRVDEQVERVALMIHAGTKRHGDVVRWEDDGDPTYFKDAHLTEHGREAYRDLARAVIAVLPPEDVQGLRDRVRVLEEAAWLASDALRMQEAWEADLIMSELEINSIPAPTQGMWDKLTDELQPSRNKALTAIRAALTEPST